MALTNQLLLFIDVVQQGSFAKAAALHNMDNSSLSKQIKKLEEQLGVQLLNRTTRSFSLTSAGEDILKQAHILDETLNQITYLADSYQSEPKGILRITSPVYFGQQYLQPVITRFMKKYRDVKITLSLDDKKSDIISDHFDLAIRLGQLSDSNFIAKKIADTHFVIVASKSFIEEHGNPLTPEALIELPAIIYGNGEVTLDQMRVSALPHGSEFKQYKMKGSYKVNDVKVVIDAVKDGLGYTMLEVSNFDCSIDKLGLVPLLTTHALSDMGTAINALYPHRKQTPLVTEFINELKAYIGTPPFWLNHIPDYQNLYK